MCFEDKLIEQFDGFKLRVPTFAKHLQHLYADYVELIALFSNENYVTAANFLDRLNDEGIKVTENPPELGIDEIASVKTEVDDQKVSWVTSVFDILSDRHMLYGESYPFEYTTNRIKLREALDEKKRIYLMLLIASNLDVFQKVASVLTSEFEIVSYYALKSYLPSHATVKQFGKNSEYTGNAKSKIRSLADDLNIKIDEVELERIPDGNIQERGLDVIGWIPFEDKNPNLVAILGQCACGKYWNDKQRESRRFEEYLRFYKLKPTHALFIPYALIDLSGGFHQSDEIHDCLLFERKRILEFIHNDAFFGELNSRAIVEKCLEFEEDVV